MMELSRTFHYQNKVNVAVLQPRICLNKYGLGYSPFARHYLGNHNCFLFLWVLRCFSSPGSPPLWIICLQHIGFPHSEISGSIHMCWSPELIAAYHVLLRLWEPRHPPRALDYFLFKQTNNISVFISRIFFQYVKEHKVFTPFVVNTGIEPVPKLIIRSELLCHWANSLFLKS